MLFFDSVWGWFLSFHVDQRREQSLSGADVGWRFRGRGGGAGFVYRDRADGFVGRSGERKADRLPSAMRVVSSIAAAQRATPKGNRRA